MPPLQRPVGKEIALSVTGEGCGAWIPAEFRMCLQNPGVLPGGGHPVAVYAREGKFFAQASGGSC